MKETRIGESDPRRFRRSAFAVKCKRGISLKKGKNSGFGWTATTVLFSTRTRVKEFSSDTVAFLYRCHSPCRGKAREETEKPFSNVGIHWFFSAR